MLTAIIRASLTNRTLVVFAALLLMAVGGYVATTMPIGIYTGSV
jgi:Cu/Ag efflux pump CusA